MLTFPVRPYTPFFSAMALFLHVCTVAFLTTVLSSHVAASYFNVPSLYYKPSFRKCGQVQQADPIRERFNMNGCHFQKCWIPDFKLAFSFGYVGTQPFRCSYHGSHQSPQTLINAATTLDISKNEVKHVNLQSELSLCFIKYAMSTILGRALPDIRDGLKPVQRRILWAMHELGLRPEMGYRKCARIVGEVLGKYHPHGDQAVYDALVRMAQDFVVSSPLIIGHGNFGSLDRDPPAAMRYTECKLSPFCQDVLLNDLRKETVDFLPNFDGNEREPTVYPAQFPVLLLNGAMGIAVGMATNIPPHNLGELADALIAMIK